jgi:hypothetical protein
MTELSDSGAIVEWGECLPDCPQEEVSSVCIFEPEFPKFSDGTPGTANYTSSYKYGSGLPTLDVRTLNTIKSLKFNKVSGGLI